MLRAKSHEAIELTIQGSTKELVERRKEKRKRREKQGDYIGVTRNRR
jgi:hypothetical protein